MKRHLFGAAATLCILTSAQATLTMKADTEAGGTCNFFLNETADEARIYRDFRWSGECRGGLIGGVGVMRYRVELGPNEFTQFFSTGTAAAGRLQGIWIQQYRIPGENDLIVQTAVYDSAGTELGGSKPLKLKPSSPLMIRVLQTELAGRIRSSLSLQGVSQGLSMEALLRVGSYAVSNWSVEPLSYYDDAIYAGSRVPPTLEESQARSRQLEEERIQRERDRQQRATADQQRRDASLAALAQAVGVSPPTGQSPKSDSLIGSTDVSPIAHADRMTSTCIQEFAEYRDALVEYHRQVFLLKQTRFPKSAQLAAADQRISYWNQWIKGNARDVSKYLDDYRLSLPRARETYREVVQRKNSLDLQHYHLSGIHSIALRICLGETVLRERLHQL